MIPDPLYKPTNHTTLWKKNTLQALHDMLVFLYERDPQKQ